MWSAIRSFSGILFRPLPWINGSMDITGHWDCPCITQKMEKSRDYAKRRQKRQRTIPPGQLRIPYLSCGMGLSLWNYLIRNRKILKKSRQNNLKKCLTGEDGYCILYEVIKITGRKVGIHLTSAHRDCDPGSYLSYIAFSLCPWIWWIEFLYLLFLYHAIIQQHSHSYMEVHDH